MGYSFPVTDEAREKIAGDLKALGVREGGVLLVHSSMRSLGRFAGGAEEVVRGLLEAVGPAGTLLMPALSYERVGAAHPVFDVHNTPSCVGWLTEYFRRRRGTLRSVHPTHSVCGLGPAAEGLLADHQKDHTPCGEHSPFRRLRRAGGQVLFLGCGLKPNTSMHSIEELVEPPYLLGPVVEYRIILAAGRETTMRVRRHSFAGWRQRYDRLGGLLAGGGLAVGGVLAAEAQLVECRAMWDAALAALRSDPFFFVERW